MIRALSVPLSFLPTQNQFPSSLVNFDSDVPFVFNYEAVELSVKSLFTDCTSAVGNITMVNTWKAVLLTTGLFCTAAVADLKSECAKGLQVTSP